MGLLSIHLASLSPSTCLQQHPPRFAMSASRVFAHASSDIRLPETHVVVGCGTVVVDYLASVAAFPQPDDKIRTIDFQLQGGGNVGNSLTAAARLGLEARLISKVSDDSPGRKILEELEADGIDTQHVVVAQGGTSPFTYVIIDKETLSRTCIHTPGFPEMKPSELPASSINAALDGADLVFFDGRLTDTAIEIAKKAKELGLPILIDAEKKRDYLDELLTYADYIVASSKFPQAWTECTTLGESLFSIIRKLPSVKFAIVTLGAMGCVMLEKSDAKTDEELDVNVELDNLQSKLRELGSPKRYVVASKIGKLKIAGDKDHAHKDICGRLLVGTADKIEPKMLVDTTGAGDAFIGAVMFSLCAGLPPEKMLPFAAGIAAANCCALGARGGLMRYDDKRLISIAQELEITGSTS